MGSAYRTRLEADHHQCPRTSSGRRSETRLDSSLLLACCRPRPLARCGGASENGVLSQLALQARSRSMPRVKRGREWQTQQLGPDAHHLPPKIRFGRLLADASCPQRVADEGVVGDEEANAAWRVAGRM